MQQINVLELKSNDDLLEILGFENEEEMERAQRRELEVDDSRNQLGDAAKAAAALN